MITDFGDERKGRLVVLVGPSAVGKSTVVREVRERLPELKFSVSATTREPRPGEVDGEDYYFVSKAEFQRMIDNNELLEWADVHGGLQRSGTPAKAVQAALDDGHPVLLEVDLNGARAVAQMKPDAVLVFMAPPSLPELVERLRKRGTETPEVITRRLETAKIELEAAERGEFHTTIVNHDVQKTVDELVSLLVGESSGLHDDPNDRAGAAGGTRSHFDFPDYQASGAHFQ